MKLVHSQDKYLSQFYRDLATTALSTLITFYLFANRINLSGQMKLREYVIIISLPVVWLFLLFVRGAYDKRRLLIQSSTYLNVVTTAFQSLLIVATANYILHCNLSRLFILTTIFVYSAMALLGRFIAYLYIQRGTGGIVRRTFVVATPSDFQSLLPTVEAIFGQFSEITNAPVSKSLSIDALTEFISRFSENERIVAVVFSKNVSLSADFLLDIRHRSDMNSITFLQQHEIPGTIGLSDFSPTGEFLSLTSNPQDAAGRFFKRCFDLGFSLIALIFTIPIMIIAAILIKLTSPGNIFYVSERLGLGQKVFSFVKLRTMYKDSDLLRSEVLGTTEAQIRESYLHDPRITPVGRLLRRWSIDEFPQFFSVLTGSMSIVGPRPILPEELCEIPPEANYRFTVKPGLTGLWQTKGRKLLPWNERMYLDMQYIDQWSLGNDVLLVFRTIRTIFKGDGAY
jgi:lipopolysaccharide/colanic/teichoic acid biosynthesis glycosyltransferase